MLLQISFFDHPGISWLSELYKYFTNAHTCIFNGYWVSQPDNLDTDT